MERNNVQTHSKKKIYQITWTHKEKFVYVGPIRLGGYESKKLNNVCFCNSLKRFLPMD